MIILKELEKKETDGQDLTVKDQQNPVNRWIFYRSEEFMVVFGVQAPEIEDHQISLNTHQPLDLPKKQRGYGRVGSLSSRSRESLDLGSATHQPWDLTEVSQGLP